jgi:hypothetical protein
MLAHEISVLWLPTHPQAWTFARPRAKLLFWKKRSPKRLGAKTKSRKRKLYRFGRNEAHKRLRAKTKSWKHKLSHFGWNEAPKRLGAKIKPRKLKINCEASKRIELSLSETKIQCLSQCFRARNWAPKQTKIRLKVAHKFLDDRGSSARRQTKNPLEGSPHRGTQQKQDHKRNEDRGYYTIYTTHETFFLLTRPGGSTRPSSTKHEYIISHSDWSKSATESRPPCSKGAVEAYSPVALFVLLDFLCGASTSSGFSGRDLCDRATREWGCWVMEVLAWDFHLLRGASAIDAVELKVSAVSAM